MATQTTGRVVYEATADWLRIVQDRDELALAEPWMGEWEAAARIAGLDLADEEAWVAQVAAVEDRHAALREGDYACCQGIGSDVSFVRLGD